MRRYDVSEPKNARSLLQRINALPLESSKEFEHLSELALRFYFWEKTPFKKEKKSDFLFWDKVFNGG